MRNKKTTMRRAFIEVADENFISIEQVASDSSMREAAIASIRREIGSLSLAEKRVAKNTLHFLRTVRDRTKGRGSMRAFFAPIGKALGRVAFAIRWTFGGIESAIRKAFSGIAFAVRWTLGGIESAIRKSFGGVEFAVRKSLGGIAFATRWTLGRIESAIRETIRGAVFVSRETRSSVAFATCKTRVGVGHLLARMRRVFAPGA
jgi:hypothetical protein